MSFKPGARIDIPNGSQCDILQKDLAKPRKGILV